jgi:hypothetical protein
MQSQDTQNTQSSLSAPFYVEVQQLATQQQLGKLHASFHTTTVNGARLIINTIVWFIVALISLYFLFDALSQIRAVLADSEALQSLGAMALISLAVFGGGLIQGWKSLREYHYRHREQLHVFEDGFVYLKDPVITKGRGKSAVVRWDEISVLMRGRLDTRHTGRILRDSVSIFTDKDELIYIYPRLQQRMELCDLLEQRYTNYRLPGIFELYKLGEELDFDKIALSKEGISRFINDEEDEETLDWQDVASIEIGDQYTRIYATRANAEKPWLDLMTVDVENALLLRKLLERITAYEQ